MTKHQIAFLASRLLSIYTLIQAIGFFQAASLQIGTYSQAVNIGINGGLMIYSAVTPIILLLAVAFVLWVFAKSVANNLVGEMEDTKVNNKLVSSDVAVVGFAVIGLFVIVKAVPNLIQDVLNYILIEKERNMGNGMNTTMKIRLIVSTLQFTIGIGLLLGSNGLVGIINTLRQSGLKKFEDD